MREKGQGAARSLPALFELLVRDQQGGDETGGHEEAAHDQRGGGEEFLGVANASVRVPRRVSRVTLDQRHHRHAGLEPGEPERQPGEDEEGDRHHHDGAAMLGEERFPPIAEHTRVRRDVLQADGHDDGIQREVGDHQRDGDADRLLEAFQEDRAQDGDQEERDGDLMPFEKAGAGTGSPARARWHRRRRG